MLAYLFWHAPAAGEDRASYEAALLAFQAELTRVGPPGLLSARTARVDSLPWLAGPGYEDCYVVADYAALGELNAAAVDARRIAAHDRVARASVHGVGALYARQAGDGDGSGEHCAYLGKPPGDSYASFAARIAPLHAPSGCSLWRRQLVLGPGPEFRIVSPLPIAPPGELQAVVGRLTPLA